MGGTESRIGLSVSNWWPNGLANSSGVVGQCLSDTIGYITTAYLPQLMGRQIENEDGIDAGHLIIPWWLQGVKGQDFRRGYHIELFRWSPNGMGYGQWRSYCSGLRWVRY